MVHSIFKDDQVIGLYTLYWLLYNELEQILAIYINHLNMQSVSTKQVDMCSVDCD